MPPHTASDENRRINVANGVALSDGTLAYAAGDANADVNPNVVEAAYTNNDNNPATGTTLFYIDDVLNILVSTANPNAGLLNTVGALGVDTDQFLGFDIFTDLGGLNQAFASLQVGGVQGLYSINLGTGAATLLGVIGMNRLHGLAVAPALVPVPEPGSLALVAVAGLAVMTLRRRRGAMAQPDVLLGHRRGCTAGNPALNLPRRCLFAGGHAIDERKPTMSLVSAFVGCASEQGQRVNA